MRILILILISISSFGQTLTKKPIKTACPFKGYVEYLPIGYDGTKQFPIIYWLAGLGETGSGSSSDLDKIYNRQISNWLKTNNVDFIVLSPQDGSGYWNGATNGIKQFVDWSLTYYKIDTLQMHMAGLSSGGYGIRDFINANTATYRKFSTFTPMSTNLDAIVGKVSQVVENKQHVWIHQGVRDTSPNALSAVTAFHKALVKLDPMSSALTAYTDLGHSAWEEVYDGTGRQKNQLGGTINGVVYTVWSPSHADWYAWLKANAKGITTPPLPEPSIDTIRFMYIQNGLLVIQTDGGEFVSPVIKVK